jgi:hypothetical protein
MIKKLTPEQIAQLPKFIDKWTKIGLSTEPADRPRAEAAIGLMYKLVGLTPPSKIIWFDSPHQMFIKTFELTKENPVSYTVKNTVIVDIITSVRSIVLNIEYDLIRETLAEPLWNLVWGQVGCQTLYHILNSITVDAPRTTVINKLFDAVYGSHETSIIARYDYYRDILGLVKETNKLNGLLELAQSCGWIFPCENVCFASERQSVLRMDSKNRLHCDNGPAVSWSDGYSIYADHGTVVPEKVVTDPCSLTFEEIKSLPIGADAVVLRKIGVEKFLAANGTKPMAWDSLFKKVMAEAVND